MSTELNQWWAYIHKNGSLFVKRYFDDLDLEEADESPFVTDRTEPFEAPNSLEAEIIAKKLLNRTL